MTEIPANIVVVSGLPRSGTSLMMQMLAAGGLPALTDEARQPDESNPRGYLEYERVKQLKKGDTGWVALAQGKVVKVVSSLLVYLPSDYCYDVVFVRRPLPEVLASQRQMLLRRGQVPDSADDSELARLYEKHLNQVAAWLMEQPNMRTLYIEFTELIQSPARPVAALQSFLSGPLDSSAMIHQVDSTLYRSRLGTQPDR